MSDTEGKNIVPNWQVIAMTIYCDIVKNEATIMVYNDWSTVCTYHQAWGPFRIEKRKGIGTLVAWLGIVDGEKLIQVNGCEGPEICRRILKYRSQLYREEESRAAKRKG